MKKLFIEETWPETWKYSYPYDLQEIWGEMHHRGYSYSYANRRLKTLELIYEKIPIGSDILDIAAAQGNFSLSLAEAGYNVTWNDLREDLVDYVKRKHEHGVIDFAPGNVFNLGFSEKFDCALITEIIEHVAHPDDFLRKVSDMVKPGGYIVMSTPNGAYFRNDLPRFSECLDPGQFEAIQFKPNSDGHIFLLWPDEVVQLAEQSGLILEKHVMYTNPLTAGHIKLEVVLKVLPKLVVDSIESLTELLPTFIKKRIMTSSASRFQKK